jgi:hypothetical protein
MVKSLPNAQFFPQALLDFGLESWLYVEGHTKNFDCNRYWATWLALPRPFPYIAKASKRKSMLSWPLYLESDIANLREVVRIDSVHYGGGGR